MKVAQGLIGKYLVHKSAEGTTMGKIVESEAYMGPDDRAAHSYGGRRTKRTEIMFGTGGYSYVFAIHGRYAFNVVASTADKPQAVLIRALEPVVGLDLMSKRRNREVQNQKDLINLTNGPSKLCMAMGIDMSLYGADLLDDTIFITQPSKKEVFETVSTPRINVDYAGEARCYPRRFLIKDNEFVSKARFSSSCSI